MKRVNRFSVSWCLFLIVMGCIDQIEVFQGSDPSIVIDGSVTNEPGPHRVRLSMSKKYNESPDYDQVAGATVKIVDDLGNEEVLSYTDNGFYVSRADFQGVVGRSYHVDVLLRSGERFYSLPEKLQPVPEIEGVTYELADGMLNFFVTFTDPAEDDNFYRWRYGGTYEVMAPVAYEMSRTGQLLRNSSCIQWNGAPPLAKDVWKCWVQDFDNEFLRVESDLLFSGQKREKMKLFAMEMNRKLDRGYNIEVRQYSLTKAAFKYWEAIDRQMKNNGTIFETSNYQISGNLRSAENASQVVLGYFGASAVTSKTAFIYDYMGLFGPVSCEQNNSGCYPERCMDCRRFAAGATNEKPDFWPY